MRWPPDFERLILEHGDDRAVHVGAKGGVRMTGLEVNPSPSPDLSSEARRWLSNNGIDGMEHPPDRVAARMGPPPQEGRTCNMIPSAIAATPAWLAPAARRLTAASKM